MTPGQRTVFDQALEAKREHKEVIAKATAIVPDSLDTFEKATQASDMIRQAMTYIDEASAAIRSQIESAKGRAFTESVYADNDWWRRANNALRFKGRQRQQLQDKYGAVNRVVRQLRAGQVNIIETSREQLFIKAASLILPKETYVRLWSIVDAMLVEKPEE